MTKQETFDTVVRHLLTQGCKAEDGEGCMYRAPGGLKCAAGALIDDADYDPSMEWTYADVGAIALALDGHDLSLVRDLQNVHDEMNVDKWPDHLAKVARKHRLDTSLVNGMKADFLERIGAEG